MSKKPRQDLSHRNADSNIINIEDLAASAKENQLKADVVRLEKLNVGLSQTVDNLLQTVESKDAEIAHLKQLLTGSAPQLDIASKFLLSNEQIISEQQLDRLRQISMQRELTLDEAKRVDIFTKIVRLCKGDPTTIEGNSLPKDVTPAELLKLASTKLKE